MTIEEIINQFPECEYIKKENLIDIVNKIFSEEKFYRNIYSMLMDVCYKLYPADDKNWGSDYSKERRNYLYGEYDEYFNNINPLGDWIHSIEDEFINRNGVHRTYEDACELAADKWVKLIFGFHIQDNGAMNEPHGGGGPACMLGTLLKDRVINNLPDTNNISKKAFDLLKKWYIDHKGNRGYSAQLDVDYGPNMNLHNILVEAGVPERDTSSICPWKTSISIDERDNCVLYHTYGHVDYI